MKWIGDTMAEKKRQHYVPQFYMRNFADSNGLFMVHHVTKKKTIGPIPYKNQCYENYFYGEDGIWENKLGQMETMWGIVFQKSITHKNLTGPDIQSLKEFALFQRQRTVAESEYRKQEQTDILIECMQMICANHSLIFDKEAENPCIKKAQSMHIPSQNLELASQFLTSIDDLDLLILHYNTKRSLISSDVPVVAINPFHPPSIGYCCMGLILLFPLSPHHLVVLYDAKMYPRFKNISYAECNDENEVSNLNTLQLLSAEEILFAAPHSTSENDLFVFTESEWESRKINREQRALSALGPPGNKLLVSSMRKTIYNCELSFGQVCHRFKRIPFICKEAPSRVWDDAWETKLKLKGDLLAEISKSTPNILAENGISIKELRRGCQRMASATQVYWTQHS